MKFLVAIATGLTVALLLFLLMHALIVRGPDHGRLIDRAQILDFIHIDPDERTELKQRHRPTKPPPPKRPPPPPKVRVAVEKPLPELLDITTPRIDVPFKLGDLYLGHWTPAAVPGDAGPVPVVRIEPSYPPRALLDGIEGQVVVEFTITEDGSVTEVEIIDFSPTHIFNGDVRRAVEKWRYRPQIVAGEAVRTRHREMINFVLR